MCREINNKLFPVPPLCNSPNGRTHGKGRYLNCAYLHLMHLKLWENFEQFFWEDKEREIHV
jgi:hypothetical protein